MNLEQLSDTELIKKIREEKCSESLQELSRRHKGLVTKTIKKFASALPNCSGVSLNDFLDESDTLVFEATHKFDETKAKFVTWLGNSVKYYCLNTLKRESKYFNESSNDWDVSEKATLNEYNNTEIKELKIRDEADYIMFLLSQIKDKRIKKIIKLRYFEEKKKNRSFKYIAKKLKMSQQGVIDLHESFIKFAKTKMGATDRMDDI